MYLEAVARRTHLRVCEHEHIDEFDAEQRYNPKNQSLQIQSWERGDTGPFTFILHHSQQVPIALLTYPVALPLNE